MGDGVVHLVAGHVMFHNVHFVIDEEAMLSFIVQSAVLDSTEVRLPLFLTLSTTTCYRAKSQGGAVTQKASA